MATAETQYAEICAKTTPFDGNIEEYAIRVFFKYLSKDGSGVAQGKDLREFLIKLEFYPTDERFNGLNVALYVPGTNDFKTNVTVEDFLEFLDTCCKHDQELVRRTFAREVPSVADAATFCKNWTCVLDPTATRRKLKEEGRKVHM